MRIPHPADPFRPADWRHCRARDLVEHGRHPHRCGDDGWTWRCWQHYLDAAGGGDRLPQPDVAAAVGVRGGDPLRRWELEARLLSREPVVSIAARFGLAARVVEAYAALFFDVLGKLNAVDHIVLHVIGFSPSRTFTEKDIEVWLKLYGYMGGPHVLDLVVDFFADPEPVPADLGMVEPSRLARLRRHLTLRASILARLVPDGDPRVFALGQLADRMEMERRGNLVNFEALYQKEWVAELIGARAAQAAGV